jgi:hypothetical protein
MKLLLIAAFALFAEAASAAPLPTHPVNPNPPPRSVWAPKPHEWMAGMGSELRYAGAKAGTYTAGGVVVTFDGSVVTQLKLANGRILTNK